MLWQGRVTRASGDRPVRNRRITAGYFTTPYPTKGAMAFKVYHFVVRINSRGEMPTILRKDFENADEELKP